MKLQTYGGESFQEIAKKASEISKHKPYENVEFDFNRIKCVVSKDTNLEWLWRDYMNAHRMKWAVVGPDCLPAYEPEMQAELDKRNKAAEQRRAKEQLEYEAKEKQERELFLQKTEGIVLEITDQPFGMFGNLKIQMGTELAFLNTLKDGEN